MNESALWEGEPSGEIRLRDFEEMLELPENQNRSLELINGYAVMMPGNDSFSHQRISGCIIDFREILKLMNPSREAVANG